MTIGSITIMNCNTAMMMLMLLVDDTVYSMVAELVVILLGIIQ